MGNLVNVTQDDNATPRKAISSNSIIHRSRGEAVGKPLQFWPTRPRRVVVSFKSQICKELVGVNHSSVITTGAEAALNREGLKEFCNHPSDGKSLVFTMNPDAITANVQK